MRMIILSKAPVAGRVKTRLMPQYSADEAALIQKKMTEVVVSKALSFCPDVWLAVDDTNHPFFKQLTAKHALLLCEQGDGSLGNRLTRLAKQSRNCDCKSIMFLGTDSPHITIERYIQAEQELRNSDIVVGAVEDGGYDLILIKEPQAAIFKGITWGSASVLSETLDKCCAEGLTVSILATSFDLDRADDLRRAPPETW